MGYMEYVGHVCQGDSCRVLDALIQSSKKLPQGKWRGTVYCFCKGGWREAFGEGVAGAEAAGCVCMHCRGWVACSCDLICYLSLIRMALQIDRGKRAYYAVFANPVEVLLVFQDLRGWRGHDDDARQFVSGGGPRALSRSLWVPLDELWVVPLEFLGQVADDGPAVDMTEGAAV